MNVVNIDGGWAVRIGDRVAQRFLTEVAAHAYVAKANAALAKASDALAKANAALTKASDAILTDAELRRDLDLWLAQREPDELLEIIADRLEAFGARPAHRQMKYEWLGLAQTLRGVAVFAGILWSERQ